MALNLKADENGLPAAADLDNLFNVCVRRVFSGQDIQTIRQTCSRLSTLCSVSSQVYDPSRGVFQDFRERYAKAHGSLTGPSKEEKKKLKKEQKKAKKKAKEEKKKAKKQAKKDKKKGKKKLSKKDRKKLNKDQKKQKKEKKKAEKKAKEAKKEAKKQAKKEANKAKKEQKKKEKETGLSDEAKKAKKEQKKEKRKAEKKAKEEKKKAKKQAKKSKKEEKKNHKEESKLIVAEQKLTRAEAKLAEKIKDFVSKTDKKYANLPRTKWSPSQIEKRLNDIRGALSTRETTSVSRFAPCLLFTPENGKDALDSQCATLRRASELTLQAEECWAGYLATVQHCKTSAKKKKDVKACYKGFDVANARCGELATRGRVELQKLLRAEQV